MPSQPLSHVLGFGRADYMNRLIGRVYENEAEFSVKLTENPPRGVVLFRNLPRSSGAGRPAKEYLLSPQQALKVIMRSEAPQAEPLQDELLDGLWMVMNYRPGVMAELQGEDDSAGAVPLKGDYRKLYFLIRHREGRSADGHRTPWIAHLQQICAMWEGEKPIELNALVKMLRKMVDCLYVRQTKEHGGRWYFLTLSMDERYAAAVAMGEEQEFRLH